MSIGGIAWHFLFKCDFKPLVNALFWNGWGATRRNCITIPNGEQIIGVNDVLFGALCSKGATSSSTAAHHLWNLHTIPFE
jgi:hypothetical protein